MITKIVAAMLAILIAVQALAQNHHNLQGIVLEKETGKVIAGVTVRSFAAGATIKTNEQGRFSIDVSVTDSLRVSHIGYKTRVIPVADSAGLLTIYLETMERYLDEVVVNTGYQKLNPNEINGSVTVLNAKILNQQTSPNILQRLDGVTSGLAFNRGYTNGNANNKTDINIRGLSTINGPLDPLIVVDNFIYEGDIANINPNDVESISVLKDAAAASIWGARAGNGVIVITTKKGRLNQKTKIEFNSALSVAAKPDLLSLPSMRISDYIDIEQFLFNQGYFDGTISTGYASLSPAVEIFLGARNGLITPTDSASRIDQLKSSDSRQQFMRYGYRRAVTQQYAISASGGSDVLAWHISGGYENDISSLDAPYNKINLRFNNSYTPFKNLRLDVGAYYISSRDRSAKYGYNEMVRIGGRYIPYAPLADADGNALAVPQLYRKAYTDTAGGGLLLDWNYYPLEDYKHNYTTTNTEQLIADIGLSYQLLKPLQLNVQYQYQRQRADIKAMADMESFSTRNTINLFSQVDREAGTVNYIVPVGDIVRLSNTDLSSWNFRSQLNFNKQLGKHAVTAIAGTEIREVKVSGDSRMLYGYKDNPVSYAADLDFVNYYPTYITGGSSSLSTNASLSNTNNRFVSFFSNLSYTFLGRYSFSASARKDGSNILGVSANDKWKPLWSVGLGWEVNREDFYGLPWLPYLKLRLTYGHSGNVDLSRMALPVAQYFMDSYTNLPAATINTINNPNLRWEQSAQTNIGLDFRGRDNVVSGSVDYYLKKGTDLYGQTPYDYTTWGLSSTIVKNVADMKGRGIDLVLNVKWIDKAWKWNTQLLFNYVSNKTTKYNTEAAGRLSTLLSGGNNNINPVVGKPLYSIAAYKWGGLDSLGNPQGYLEGKLSTDYKAISREAVSDGMEAGNLVYIGSAIPRYFGSLINTIQYKGLELSFNISYKAGYYFKRPALNYSSIASGLSVGTGDYAKRWQESGDEEFTDIPSFTYPASSARDAFYASSEINVLKGDHLRLQYINLSYSFNLPQKSGLPFKGLLIYANAANLGILWRKNAEGIDPDYVNSIPEPKVFTIGVRSNF